MAKDETSYQEAMDQMHAPDTLVQKTLNVMDVEIKKRKKAKIIPIVSKRLTVFVAAAACIALFLGLRQLFPHNESLSFQEIHTSDLLQMSYGIKGNATDATVEYLEAYFGIELKKLIPGYTLRQANANQLRTSEKMLSSLQAEYYSDDAYTVSMEMSDYMSPLYSVMADFEPVKQDNGTLLRFAKDADAGTLYAIWEKNEVYYTLSSYDLQQEQFVELVKSITNAN